MQRDKQTSVRPQLYWVDRADGVSRSSWRFVIEVAPMRLIGAGARPGVYAPTSFSEFAMVLREDGAGPFVVRMADLVPARVEP